MKNLVFCGLLLAASIGCAHAQSANGQNTQPGAVFELPGDVSKIVAVDAQNTLIVEKKGRDGSSEYNAIVVRHVYAGSIARLFGGTILPTLPFVSPGFNRGNNNGNANNGNGNSVPFGVNQTGGGNNQNNGFNPNFNSQFNFRGRN